jgi:hypothetical protein
MEGVHTSAPLTRGGIWAVTDLLGPNHFLISQARPMATIDRLSAIPALARPSTIYKFVFLRNLSARDIYVFHDHLRGWGC